MGYTPRTLNHHYRRGDQLRVGHEVYTGDGYTERYSRIVSVTPCDEGEVRFETEDGHKGAVRYGFEILVKGAPEGRQGS